MNLFRSGAFTLANNGPSMWKIDCDALIAADWDTLAQLAAAMLPPYSDVEGVPGGGLAFADALKLHAQPGHGLLIAEDVVTTGASMEKQRHGREALGIAVFGRNSVQPPWVWVLFQYLGVDGHE